MRSARFHGTPDKDQRDPFEVDRDRIQYSSAFHRLAGVTQIVRAGEEEVFHTRQQHTYKVAQVGRRLAQRCVKEYPEEAERLAINPEVVEAACLAHDLGHPPFGHAGEDELNKLVEAEGDLDGFEGNAQTFRILVKLGVRFEDCFGLDPTRATLAACLKYPWLRDTTKSDRTKKWGAYEVDAKEFNFARENHDHSFQTAEAALMDWADDIAYSVHDLEDFHRCGAIPWAKILDETNSELVSNTLKSWYGAPEDARSRLDQAFHRICELLSAAFGTALLEPYDGSREQRVALRNLTSTLIGRFIAAARLTDTGSGIAISPDEEAEVKILKQITKDYIISTPSLAAQQHGQRRVIADVFKALHDNAGDSFPRFLPVRLRYIWLQPEGSKARFAADSISCLTEKELTELHGRLFGTASGSVLDPIVR